MTCKKWKDQRAIGNGRLVRYNGLIIKKEDEKLEVILPVFRGDEREIRPKTLQDSPASSSNMPRENARWPGAMQLL